MVKKDISTKLFDEAKIVREPGDTKEDFIAKVMWLMTELDQILVLGWAEHTNDWDLGLWLTRVGGGGLINSCQGYAEFEIGILNENGFIPIDIKDFVIGLDNDVNAIRMEVDADWDEVTDEEYGISKKAFLLDDIQEMGIYD